MDAHNTYVPPIEVNQDRTTEALVDLGPTVTLKVIPPAPISARAESMVTKAKPTSEIGAHEFYKNQEVHADNNDDTEIEEEDDDDIEDEEDEADDKEEIYPDHYYDGGKIPVFKPTLKQFESFKKFIKKIDHYGMKSGIVKVIPPPEWTNSLPDVSEKLKSVRIHHPIVQHITGSGGVFSQTNIEKKRNFTLPQWRKLTEKSDHQPPARRGERRKGSELVDKSSPRKRLRTKSLVTDDGDERVNEVQSLSLDHPVAAPASKSNGSSKYKKRAGGLSAQELAEFENFDYRFDASEFTPERCSELERIYWKTISYNNPMYGADMLGSLFDDSTSLWNVAHLENILNDLDVDLPGVNTAYLYFGMWKSTFSWHLEDMDLYSINYLHFGAPKNWYSISQEDSQKFFSIMKNEWPNDYKKCREFLRHKTYLVSPSYLANHGIKVNRLVHNQGEFVITFPYGYHSGFNFGYNCAESVNFATERWLDIGSRAKKCNCISDAVGIDVEDLARRLSIKKQIARLEKKKRRQSEETSSPTSLDSTSALNDESFNYDRKSDAALSSETKQENPQSENERVFETPENSQNGHITMIPFGLVGA
ncbi:JmjC domain, hydroxylase-domain-containing protein [Dipodascopsis uninucleata]